MQDLVNELNSALAAVQAALDAANASPAPEVDPVWAAVEQALTSNGWQAPQTIVQIPVEVPNDTPEEAPVADAPEASTEQTS